MLNKISRLLVTIVLFLVTIILFKSSSDFKNWYYKNILNNTLSFTTIASKYEELFGKPIPFKKNIIEPVFEEKLKYNSIKKYKEGYLVDLENDLIPSLTDGLVIFIGKKDDNLCVVVEKEKTEISYCMLKNVGVKLYDHVSKGSYIGEANEKLFLILSNGGDYLDYEEFI